MLLGLHGEGSTVRTLFTLLFWDIMFADGIPDVFYSQFQTSPLDLFTDNFYISRQEMIEQRLVSVSNSTDEVLQQFIVFLLFYKFYCSLFIIQLALQCS